MMTDSKERGRWLVTFTGGQLAFELVVPVGFGRQRRLGFFVIEAI